jgi:hypothetical protein
MGADATLVEGAYRASKHYDMGLAEAKRRASDKISELGKKKPGVVDPASTKIKPTSKTPKQVKAEADTDKAATQDVGVTPGDKEQLRASLKEGQDRMYDYVSNKDNAGKDDLMAETQKKAEDMNAFEQTFTEVNEDWQNRGEHTAYGYGNSLEYADEGEKEWLMDMIKGGSSNTKLQELDGQLFVEGPNGEMYTEPELRKKLDGYKVSNEQFNQISDLASFYREKGISDGAGNLSFDYEKAKGDIAQIIEGGNINSLALDKSFGNTSYMEDLFNSDDLANIKYEDLGIDPPEGDEDGAITAGDNIDEHLKGQIMKKLLDSEYKDGLKNSLTNYFTSHLQRNYEAEMKLDLGYVGPRGTGGGIPQLEFGSGESSPEDLLNKYSQ